MARERRERLLAFLDALGKWSLIDMFVLVMMMVAFRFQLAVPMVIAVCLFVFGCVNCCVYSRLHLTATMHVRRLMSM